MTHSIIKRTLACALALICTAAGAPSTVFAEPIPENISVTASAREDETDIRNNDSNETVLPEKSVVHYDAVEPTCAENGNIEYWYDTETDKIYLDEDCTEEATLEDVTIRNHGHHFGTDFDWKWNKDRTEAFFTGTCKDCGEKVNEKADITHRNVSGTYLTGGENSHFATVTILGKTYNNLFSGNNGEYSIRTTKTPIIYSSTVTDKGVELKWTRTYNAQYYAVGLFIDNKWRVVARTDERNCVIKGLEPGKKYKAAVIFLDMYIGRVNGTIANVVEIPGSSAVPFPLVGAWFDWNTLNLNWSPVDGAEGYVIAYQTEGKWKMLTTVPATTTSFKRNPMPVGEYKIAVAAKKNGRIDTSNIDKSTVTVKIDKS